MRKYELFFILARLIGRLHQSKLIHKMYLADNQLYKNSQFVACISVYFVYVNKKQYLCNVKIN